MRIIPAIDIIEGKCVRLTKGDYNQKIIYDENPLEVAKKFEDNGFSYLHLVDLDGAKSNQIVNWKILEKIATKTQLKIDFGGGIKSDKSINTAFNCGANQVVCGSISVKNEKLFVEWIHKYGAEKVILGADVKDGNIAISGWLENVDIDLNYFLTNYKNHGIKHVICTDIDKDGMLKGTSIKLYKQLSTSFPELNIIASGGISSTNDLKELKKINVGGAIIGKAIYENKITLKELKNYVD